MELRIPYSGRLLISHLAAYGLASVLDRVDDAVLVAHDSSLELTPAVITDANLARVAAAISASARECEKVVELDLEPEKRGNERIPVIRARATDPERATLAFQYRELLLDELEASGAHIAAGLLAGLGAPAPWLRHEQTKDRAMPGRGATELDGVPYNIGSDIVRGALRHSLPVARALTVADLELLLAGHADASADRLRWSPPGTAINLTIQWLAALGMMLIPVGLTAAHRARTPAFWRHDQMVGVTLPILAQPASVARLRALLQRRELTERPTTSAVKERLKALGIAALATFPRNGSSSSTMVQFSFDPAIRLDL